MSLADVPPSPSWDPSACSWEWGGVPEATPLPCADLDLSKLAGAGLAVVGFAAVLALVGVAVLVVIAIRMGSSRAAG